MKKSLRDTRMIKARLEQLNEEGIFIQRQIAMALNYSDSKRAKFFIKKYDENYKRRIKLEKKLYLEG